jgi:hypothetical protein
MGGTDIIVRRHRRLKQEGKLDLPTITRLDIDSRHPLAVINEIQRAYDALPDDEKAGSIIFTNNIDVPDDRGPEMWSGSKVPLAYDDGTRLLPVE